MRHFVFWWFATGLFVGCGSSKNAVVPPVDTGTAASSDDASDDEEN